MRPLHPLADSGHDRPGGYGASQPGLLHLVPLAKDRSPDQRARSALHRAGNAPLPWPLQTLLPSVASRRP